jgi:perosamine synthetase
MKIRDDVIAVLGPKGDDDDIQAITETINSGWWVNGPKVEEFENKFKEMVGSKYAIGVTSNTSGLDMIFKAYDINDGDDVISPTNSFATTYAVPLWNKCSSRLADIDPINLNICPSDVKNMIKPNTKAIIVVNHAGVSAKNSILEIRKFFKGLIIEDCAHSCYVPGAGSFGDIAVWSFQGVKTMPTGDGGMITLNDENIYKKIKKLIWFGIESTYSRDKNSGRFGENKNKAGYRWQYDIDILGYKCYMIDLTASLGLSQLNKLNKNLERRRFIQQKYNEAFENITDFQIPPWSETCQYYCARVNVDKRDNMIDYLSDKKIHTSVHFRPLHLFTYYKQDRSFPVADIEWLKLISLPVHLNMTDDDIEYVIYWVNEFFKDN